MTTRKADPPGAAGQAVASTYAEHPPPAALREIVACTWERTVAPGAAAASRVLPDGCVDLIWAADRGPFVAGPDRGPVVRTLDGGFSAAGLRLRPGVAGSLLGVPASALLDARIPLEELWGDGAAGALAEALDACRSGAERRRALGRAVAARRERAAPADRLVLASVPRLAGRRAPVAGLADELGVSERQLRRRFHAAVGYGPKTLARVLRFRRFLGLGPALAAGEDGLAGAAAAAGYADQAHLARECRELSGLTPGRLVEEGWGAPAQARLGAQPSGPCGR